MLIDCDIHVGYSSLADLLPYMDAPTRELVTHSGTHGLAMPSYPWNHPTGWIRKDTYERQGFGGTDFTYVSLDQMRAQHLDLHEIAFGVLEPDEAAAFAILPNSHLAAKLCSAYNDWLLENWLERDERLRAVLVVPAQFPEAAAAEIRRIGERAVNRPWRSRRDDSGGALRSERLRSAAATWGVSSELGKRFTPAGVQGCRPPWLD